MSKSAGESIRRMSVRFLSREHDCPPRVAKDFEILSTRSDFSSNPQIRGCRLLETHRTDKKSQGPALAILNASGRGSPVQPRLQRCAISAIDEAAFAQLASHGTITRSVGR